MKDISEEYYAEVLKPVLVKLVTKESASKWCGYAWYDVYKGLIKNKSMYFVKCLICNNIIIALDQFEKSREIAQQPIFQHGFAHLKERKLLAFL
jgi:hypothetical protein